MAALLGGSDMPRSKSGGWRRQLRRAVNETLNMKIIGSEFQPSGSGTPKYDHDRCERSVQMRLYTMSKGQFALVFAVCLLMFVILLMIGLAGPPITAVRQRRASELSLANSTNLATGPIIVSSPILSTYCQQLWIIARIETSSSREGGVHEIYDTTFQINSEVLATTAYTDATDVLANGKRSGTSQNRSMTLKCQNNICDEIIMAHLGFIDYSQYHFIFRFFGLKTFSERFGIREITFYFKSYHPSFTRLEIWVRFSFVFLSLIATIWFHQNLRAYPLFHWSIEQKWLAMLLPLLLLFNDPLFPLIFLLDSAFPAVVDSIFQTTFLCSLLMFWLCIYHGIKQTTRRFWTFYFPKLILVLLLWITMITMAVLHRVAALDEVGSGGSKLETSHGFQTFLYVIGGLYLLYLFVLVIRSYKELRNLPYFDTRLKFFTAFMLVVIGVIVSISVLRFGVTPTLEDNFVSHLSTSYGSSAEFMAFYGLLNCYLFTMAFVYSPNPSVVADLQMIEQPPPSASALLNDDSEDELYGPDLSSKNLHFGEDESDAD